MVTTAENSKRIAKNTLLLYVRTLFGMIVGFYTSRVLLKTLGVEDLGIYNVVGGVVTMFGFLSSSLSGATQRYITVGLGYGDMLRLNKLFSITLSIHLVFAVIIIVLAETIGLWFLMNKMQIPVDRMNAALWVYQGSIVTTVIMIISVPYKAAIIAHERMNIFAYLSILETVLKLGILFLLPCFSVDNLILYAILIVISQLFMRICYKCYCNKYFEETMYNWIWDKTLFKEILVYTGWTLNGNLAVIGYTQGLNILLNLFFSPVVNAARSIAVQVDAGVRVFCSNFQTALNPQLTISYTQGNYAYMHQLMVLSSKFSCYLVLFLSLPVIFEVTFILECWLTVVPDYTAVFVRIILLSSMLSAIANPIIISIHATGNIRYFQIVEGSILLSIVPLSYLLLKFTNVPPQSVFWVHLVVEICAQYARIRIVLPQVHMSINRYIKQVIYPILAVGLLSPILPYIVYSQLPKHTLVSFAIVSMICFLSTGLSVYFVGCTRDEKAMMKIQMSKLYKKMKFTRL